MTTESVGFAMGSTLNSQPGIKWQNDSWRNNSWPQSAIQDFIAATEAIKRTTARLRLRADDGFRPAFDVAETAERASCERPPTYRHDPVSASICAWIHGSPLVPPEQSRVFCALRVQCSF